MSPYRYGGNYGGYGGYGRYGGYGGYGPYIRGYGRDGWGYNRFPRYYSGMPLGMGGAFEEYW